MFADDTNLFLKHKNLHTLFDIANQDLLRINGWFISNELLLNVWKTKFFIFHSSNKKDDIPLMLTKLNQINNQHNKRVDSIKLLGVLPNESVLWKRNIKHIEEKLSKSISLLYKAKQFVGESSLLALYYSYIHIYLNYANIG